MSQNNTNNKSHTTIFKECDVCKKLVSLRFKWEYIDLNADLNVLNLCEDCYGNIITKQIQNRNKNCKCKD